LIVTRVIGSIVFLMKLIHTNELHSDTIFWTPIWSQKNLCLFQQSNATAHSIFYVFINYCMLIFYLNTNHTIIAQHIV